jgi:GTPase SAR1 family protein
MASSQAPVKTPGAINAQRVIEMFVRDLGLPVCDDEGAINKAVESQRGRRLAEKRNPDHVISHAAEEWFKTVDALKNPQRRAQLLGIVFEHYCNMVDTALRAARGSGVVVLTGELRESLRTIAEGDCKTDANLTRRFVQDYLKLRDFEDGTIVKPKPVGNFTARGELGRVVLSWQLPQGDFEGVEIFREGGTGGGAQRPVYRGSGAGFADSEVTAGISYLYRAVSYWQDVKMKETPPEARAVPVGEVRDAKAVWDKGAVRVSWQLPAANIPVIVFKRAGAAPATIPGTNGPEPDGNGTIQLHRGNISAFSDTDVAEGVTYHYLIVADFSGVCGPGVRVQLAVPKAPSPVASVSAGFQNVRGSNEVSLQWPGIPGGASLEYVVVRREGSIPASTPEAQNVLHTTTQTSFIDQNVVCGRRYTYTIFTRSGELYSRNGTSANPVDTLADVSELDAKTADGTIQLSWQRPDGAEHVVVRRGTRPPQKATDGDAVTITGPGSAKDEHLANDGLFHYLVTCVYRPDGKTEMFSPGVRISAMPVALPDPVQKFTAEPQGREIVCTWEPPAKGQVVILRSAKAHDLDFGRRIAVKQMDQLGERIVAPAEGRAVDGSPEIGKPYYSIFTVAGANAVVGATDSAVAIPDPSNLNLNVNADGICLRWQWPKDATIKGVRIVRRTDTWPEGPQDPKASHLTCGLQQYLGDGEKFVDSIRVPPCRFYYCVFAEVSTAAGQWHSPGTGAGSRAEIQWAPRMTLRYRLSAGKGPRGEKLRLTWTVEQPFDNFAGFALVASNTEIPGSIVSGTTLFPWSPAPGEALGTHQAWISLDSVVRSNWSLFYCKLFITDAAQAGNALVIHPNISIPISGSGEFLVPARGEGLRRYTSGVPRTIICPYCFQEFPLEEMWFTSFSGGGDNKHAKYSWLQRILKRPLRAPKNERGQVLTRRLCPDLHDLPYTAGEQSSLVIGVIGGKYSGKSTYIASLINRLESQVCGDLQGALLAVSEEGQQRYRDEFYGPLFGFKREIGVTVGSPPPLIYELSMDGKLFGETRNRSVTLSLYDTAGENLNNADQVRRTVQYLKVASGIMFLIDPLQVPSVRERISSHVRLPPQDQAALPQNIIGSVMTELQAANVVGKDGRLSIPVAVVLTKCDQLRDSGLIEPNRLWREETRHVGYFDGDVHSDTAGMMAEYVKRWSDGAYNVVRQKFAHAAFFGVSATGSASDPSTGRYPFISPWRVEDPVLWLLSELGVIRTKVSGD